MKIFKLTLRMLPLLLFSIVNSYSQIGGVIPEERITSWNNSGTISGIPAHLLEKAIDITFYHNSEDGEFYDNAIDRAFHESESSGKYVIFFPEGLYKFHNKIVLPSGIVLKGEGSDKSKLFFNLASQSSDCIFISGSTGIEIAVTEPIVKGQNFVSCESILTDFNNAEIVDLYHGEDVFGEDNIGFKQYQKAQLLTFKYIEGNKIYFEEPVRLDYSLQDEWGMNLLVREINPAKNCGIEDLYITREDTPPVNGYALITFYNAYNCWLSGVETFMGANYHVEIRKSKNIEIRGCYFHHAYNYGEGGNGYGATLVSTATDCLIEDNIFESLRHSMLCQSSSNGNVFGYNASFNKPDDNWNEASLSVHGHFAYYNLFEGNYAEYANVDFVWGTNGPYNTFLRNYIYHEGYYNNAINNQQLEVEEGTDKNNVVANLAFAYIQGEDNFVRENYKLSLLPEDKVWSEISYYKESKPNFISDAYTWPCYGLKISDWMDSPSNIIPAVSRILLEKKTISAASLALTEVEDQKSNPGYKLSQNYPNPFNPTTVIEYRIPEQSFVTIEIFDILGKRIATLVYSERQVGIYQIEFDSVGISSGVYFYSFQSVSQIDGSVCTLIKKMICIK
ncbi:MAG: T9SS type A sorting domain-containing protein [bacterium]